MNIFDTVAPCWRKFGVRTRTKTTTKAHETAVIYCHILPSRQKRESVSTQIR